MRQFVGFCLIIVLLFGSGCKETVSVNADYKPIWVVFGMLRSQDTVHYIRVSKAFLTNEDAVKYAKENDNSVKGLNVSITDGQHTYPAIQVDSVLRQPMDGTFFPYMTYYEIHTPPLVSGYYRLEIKDPQNEAFFLTSHTTVPYPPVIYRPRLLYDPFSGYCLDSLRLGKTDSIRFPHEEGIYYDIKFYLYYQKNQRLEYTRWGTNYPFQTNHDSYRFEHDYLLSRFQKSIQDSASVLSIETQPECGNFARYFTLEFTQLDSFLYRFYYINNPIYLNYNDYRPTYTNISGTQEAVGVFGSLGVRRVPLKISAAERALLGF